MTPPATLPAPPPAFRRAGPAQRQERKPEPVPFASLYAKFEKYAPEVIRQAIDRLIADGHRSIDEFRVAELIGRVPFPPALDKEPVPLHIPGPPNDEVQAAHLARVARQCQRPAQRPHRYADRIAAILAKPAVTRADAHFDTRAEVLAQRYPYWHRLPSADWYGGECGG